MLIVVAIILVIAAIAIPNFLQSRIAANESSAACSVRTIITSELTYANLNAGGGYTTLANLGAAGLLDNTLAAGVKSGFNFAAAPNGSTSSQFLITADPQSSSTGTNHYCAVENGLIQRGPATFGGYTACANATPPATPIGN